MSQRLERLLNLTAALLHAGRPLTSAEIAERVPGYPEREDRANFQRQFERDKAALRDLGIPVALVDLPGTEPVEQGYLIRREDYALRDPGLAPDELAALQLALAMVRVEGLPGADALWKLGGTSAEAAAGAPLGGLPALPHLATLFGAVAARATVRFGYRGDRRSVDPYRLRFLRGHWYLDGFDHQRGAERQFRLDRIEGDVEQGTDGAFERPPAPPSAPLQPWALGGDPAVVARLAVDADQAPWAVAELGEPSVVARADDGAVELEVEVTNRDGFRSFVLGFLDHAEVLSPPELRDELVAWLAGVGE